MYIKEGYWKGYISFLKNEYKMRYDLMKRLLEEELKEYVTFIDPKGGLTFYIKLKNKEINSEEYFIGLRKESYILHQEVYFILVLMKGIILQVKIFTSERRGYKTRNKYYKRGVDKMSYITIRDYGEDRFIEKSLNL